MKNRTVIGIICMALAVAITFLVAPLVNRLSTDTTDVIRLAEDVKQGTQITAEHLETIKVKTDSIPTGTLKDPKDVVGKYAASKLYAGDWLTAEKLTGEANSASDVFAALDGTKVAVSVSAVSQSPANSFDAAYFPTASFGSFSVPDGMESVFTFTVSKCSAVICVPCLTSSASRMTSVVSVDSRLTSGATRKVIATASAIQIIPITVLFFISMRPPSPLYCIL